MASRLQIGKSGFLLKAELQLFDATEIEADLAKTNLRNTIIKGRSALGEVEDFEF